MIPDHLPVIDTTVADPARRHGQLRGKVNFAVDRASGDNVTGRFPTIAIAGWEHRRFMRDAVTLAKAGVQPASLGRASGTPAGLVVSGGVPLSQPPVLRRHTPITLGPKGCAS